MARYFFDLHDTRGYISDEEGRDFDDVADARQHAVRCVRSIVADDVMFGFIDLTPRIEIRSATDEQILTVRFAEAVLRVVVP